MLTFFRQLVRQLLKPFLVIDDLNSLNPLWRDTFINPRGNYLFALLEDLELETLNTD